MKKISFIKAMSAFILVGIAICVIGGDLNPGNTPSPTMRTLDELYKNIQSGLPSDWKPFPMFIQCQEGGAINMSIEGQNQGQIYGSCTTEYREDTIIVAGLGHQVTAPLDSQSGLPTGHIDTGIYYVTKYIDQSSPKLYRAMCDGEHLTQVLLKFYRINAADEQEYYYRIRMQDALIVSIRTAFPNLEEIGFLPREMTWRWEDGSIEFNFNFYTQQ